MKKTFHVHIALGTRPEAIKMLPLVLAAPAFPQLQLSVINTGQHKELTQEILGLFGVQANYSFQVMRPSQTLSTLTESILSHSEEHFSNHKPDALLVHGDTTTAFAMALGAFYAGVPVGHVEAGLRTGDITSPFPEEMNRHFIDSISRWHYAPTLKNRAILHEEGHPPGNVAVVGNTVIDSLHFMRRQIERQNDVPSWLDSISPTQQQQLQKGRFFLVTLHRRENHGKLAQILFAIKEAMQLYPQYCFVLPVHPNPAVKDIVTREFAEHPNMILLSPQNYKNFVWLLSRCRLVLTDSGGLQEEAPALGKPCVVLRNRTERLETLQCGWGSLGGTSSAGIIRAIQKEMNTPPSARGACPYGKGNSAYLILNHLRHSLTHPDQDTSEAFIPHPKVVANSAYSKHFQTPDNPPTKSASVRSGD